MVLGQQEHTPHSYTQSNNGGGEREPIDLITQMLLSSREQSAMFSENRNKRAALKQYFLESATVLNAQEGYVSAPDFNNVIRPDILWAATEVWYDHFKGKNIQYIAGLPVAGERYVPTLAILLNASILPARKTGTTPGSWDKYLAYISDSFTTKAKSVQSVIGHTNHDLSGKKVLLVDDVVARGNTAIPAIQAFQAAGAEVELAALFSKKFQGGVERIKAQTGVDVFSIITILALTENNGIELE